MKHTLINIRTLFLFCFIIAVLFFGFLTLAESKKANTEDVALSLLFSNTPGQEEIFQKIDSAKQLDPVAAIMEKARMNEEATEEKADD